MDGKDRPHMKVTTASEIFALGSALYYMVTGHDIFPELDYGLGPSGEHRVSSGEEVSRYHQAPG